MCNASLYASRSLWCVCVCLPACALAGFTYALTARVAVIGRYATSHPFLLNLNSSQTFRGSVRRRGGGAGGSTGGRKKGGEWVKGENLGVEIERGVDFIHKGRLQISDTSLNMHPTCTCWAHAHVHVYTITHLSSRTHTHTHKQGSWGCVHAWVLSVCAWRACVSVVSAAKGPRASPPGLRIKLPFRPGGGSVSLPCRSRWRSRWVDI